MTFRSETNFRIHLTGAFLAILLSTYLSISRIEWVAIILCIVLVLAAEVFNTSIEKLVDLMHPERSDKAGVIKDISAGAVLITAIGSLVVAGIILGPNALKLL